MGKKESASVFLWLVHFKGEPFPETKEKRRRWDIGTTGEGWGGWGGKGGQGGELRVEGLEGGGCARILANLESE